jgi:hypothetical protein
MKKILGMAGIMLYNLIITLIANDLSLGASGTAIPDTSLEVGFNLSFLEDLMGTFADMLTFNVTGLPDIFILIFVYLVNMVLLLLIVAFIFNRD